MRAVRFVRLDRRGAGGRGARLSLVLALDLTEMFSRKPPDVAEFESLILHSRVVKKPVYKLVGIAGVRAGAVVLAVRAPDARIIKKAETPPDRHTRRTPACGEHRSQSYKVYRRYPDTPQARPDPPAAAIDCAHLTRHTTITHTH